ncbi:MAG TPA: preprotein translocase subunit SecE [Opitutae bacterium]|nr:preprotein translocase subunit SecE [Opitutae bacterium]HAF59237.1 preprotein translocase subunit SecE [Opitutae bacterium]
MNPFTKVRTFYKETMSELRKATWPDFHELRGSTAVVVAGVFILGLFISVADFSLSNWIEYATQLLRN